MAEVKKWEVFVIELQSIIKSSYFEEAISEVELFTWGVILEHPQRYVSHTFSLKSFFLDFI